MSIERVVGRVTAAVGSPSTTTQVRFWVPEGVLVRPFDFVRITHLRASDHRSNSSTYAVVQELEYLSDAASHLANFVSADFGDVDVEPFNRRLGATLATAEVIHNDQDVEMPIRDGAAVSFADPAGIREALGLSNLRRPVPAGFMSMSNGAHIAIAFDASFLVGPEGAHLNISGISGLAAKTSYAMFLMNALQQQASDRVSMVIFNVKGSDLLYIDREPDEALGAEKAEDWRRCGLEPRLFSDVTYMHPFKKSPPAYTSSQVDPEVLQDQRTADQAFTYHYSVQQGLDRLPLLFADIEDPTSSMGSIFDALQSKSDTFDSWEALREEARRRATSGTKDEHNISKQSWKRFERLLRLRTTSDDLFCARHNTDAGAKRQRSVAEAIAAIKPGQILVVDIEPLPDYLQCFVVGDVVRTVLDIKRGNNESVAPSDLGTVVVFADELNKFAPKSLGASSDLTLTDSLLEITERGRSLGLVLFGAEQFRSGVHDRVLGNCGTNAYGRTSPVEVAKSPDYRLLPKSYQSAVTRLPQGSLLLQHPVFRSALLKVRFPYPCYRQPKARI